MGDGLDTSMGIVVSKQLLLITIVNRRRFEEQNCRISSLLNRLTKYTYFSMDGLQCHFLVAPPLSHHFFLLAFAKNNQVPTAEEKNQSVYVQPVLNLRIL